LRYGPVVSSFRRKSVLPQKLTDFGLSDTKLFPKSSVYVI
jgi:hypothetical protein